VPRVKLIVELKDVTVMVPVDVVTKSPYPISDEGLPSSAELYIPIRTLPLALATDT